MEEFLKLVDWIEKYPVVGTAILALVGYIFLQITKFIYDSFTKTEIYVGSVFWTFGKKYRISAVHKYEPSNNSSGYSQKQHSRQDQWNKLVNIKSSFLNLRHEIIPKNIDDILVVMISRNGKETEKIIKFNK